MAGRLKYFLSEWKLITTDLKILDMVQHCHLEFIEIPSQHYNLPPIRFNTRGAKIIDDEIKTLLNKGVIEEAQPSQHQVISSIFLRKKKNGSYRMILNLKGLNEFIEYKHFKMESLAFAVQLMRKNCYIASIDLTDGYYTVPVAPEHRKYLRFMWGGKLFQYACLPNGLCSAPRYLTKLLKPVYGTLRSQGNLNVGYIDDSCLQASSVSDCSQNIWATTCLFENLQSWTKVLGQIYICGAFSHPPNKFMYTCSAPPLPPPPTMLDTCTRYFSRVSTLYWGVRGWKQRILKRITVLFQNSVLKTPKINAITRVSQRILCTIVGFVINKEK